MLDISKGVRCMAIGGFLLPPDQRILVYPKVGKDHRRERPLDGHFHFDSLDLVHCAPPVTDGALPGVDLVKVAGWLCLDFWETPLAGISC